MGIKTVTIVTCDICNHEIAAVRFLNYSDYGAVFHKQCGQELVTSKGIEEFLKLMNLEPSKHWDEA